MEINSQINTFAKGLNMDTDVTMLPEGQYRYAENIRLLTNADGTTGMLQNIEHIRQYNGGIPEDEEILGTAITRLYSESNKGTIECGIVVTKKIKNNNVYNTIYTVTGFDSISPTTTPIVKGYLELQDKVSIITNYESDTVSNIYICDGQTPIKVINIQEDNSEEISDPTRFDITPGCVMMPFTLVNTINGALPSGAIQYCYQLFNMNGPETTTSSLSEVIPITGLDSAGSSDKIRGQKKGTISGKGCQIKARFSNDGRFDRVRIFSIVYLDNVSIPDIYIINEVQIPRGDRDNYDFVEFTYDDTGASFLSKLTVDEFNAMVPYEFNAKSIEKMSNRLFASNVQEITWDIDADFDTRAYRCDINGNVRLQDSTVNNTIEGYLSKSGKIYNTYQESVNDSGDRIIVSSEHDCINPSNVEVLEKSRYMYYVDQHGDLIRGGNGENIQYRFTYTELVLSDSITPSNISLNVNLSVSKITTYYEDGSIAQNGINVLPTGGRLIIPNYADPYICANYLGYQRDEIYRFGIIFYNKKNIPSPVHWIGDIRMPSTHDVQNIDSLIHPFHKGKTSQNYEKTVELLTYALGIEFKLKNVPSDVLAYEIVRCDRTSSDRTVLTQGILGALYKFTDWSKGKDNHTGEYGMGENDIRPVPMFSMVNNFKTYYAHGGEADWDYDDYHTASPGYFEFVSPEIVISKDTITGLLRNNDLKLLYNVNSCLTNRVSISQINIHTVSKSEPLRNDPDFGLLTLHSSGNHCINMGHGVNTNYYGYAGVFKYYNYSSDYLTEGKVLKIDDLIISNTLPYFINLDDAKSHAQFIGNKTYVNTSIGGYRQFSNHGINAVLKVDETFNPYMSTDKLKNYCTGFIANVKQNIIPYGGNTYVNRQNSVYNSCGCFVEDTKMYNPVICYGGDTYLGVLDYLNTSVIQQSNDVDKERQSRLCCICYIPLESQVNLNLRSDESYHRQINGMIGPNLIQNEPTVLPNGYVQKTPYYEYNPVYSATSGSKQYIPKSIYAEDNKINQNRIVSSELKTNNEITDSWTKFKFANYIDVDSQYGQITNLKVFNNKLYFFQDNAVGIAAVNERSLINDNIAELTLGTGGILTRFDYVATLNGSSIVNDKSIVSSASTIYWYDFDKNEICAMSNALQPLSKIKNVQSYLNTLPKSVKSNAVSFYDKKYNEVWFRLYDKTLVYNEFLQAFTSFYTHNPNWFFPFSDKLVTIKDNNMYYLHNIYEQNSDVKEERISKIEFVVNKDISNTKVFDNVVFSADLLDNDNSTPNIVKDVVFKTKTQETEPIDYNNIEVREDNYRFPISREKVSDNELNKITSQSYLGRMRGKYLICDYTFDCNNNREFKLPYIKTTYRYSLL